MIDFDAVLFAGAKSKSTFSPAGPQDAASTSSRHPPRILIVEDELMVAWHIESILEGFRFEVCDMIPDGETAIVKAAEYDPDVILMDINLSKTLDGIETARTIRESSDTAIIFITAYVDAGTLGRIEREIPGSRVLTKPVMPEQLWAAIVDELQLET